VKVYKEQPIFQGFNNATCYLPDNNWENIEGFSVEQIENLEKIIRLSTDLIYQFVSYLTDSN